MLYHKDIFMLPEIKNLPTQRWKLVLESHALEKIKHEEDKFGVHIDIPETLIFSGEQIIEADIEYPVVKKVLIRYHLDEIHDICWVIMKVGNKRICKTMWVNKREDVHKTLDKTKYYNEVING